MIAGDTNAGKSSVTYQMGLDVASGKNTLGFPAPAEPVVDEVVYIDTELSDTQLGQRFGGITISDRMKYIDATAWDLERILSEIETIAKNGIKKGAVHIGQYHSGGNRKCHGQSCKGSDEKTEINLWTL